MEISKCFFKKNWHIVLINVILTACYILGYGRFGNAIVDSFREAYIPSQMLDGQALYKNIFTIYPPLAYIINAFLFFIFGVKLKVLYFAGFLAALGVINITFKLGNKFLPKIYSFAIALFIIASAVLSPNVFNLFFPYSFGVLYGTLFMLLSIYCMVRGKSALAYFLYALAICSKYEFFLALPVFIWMSGKKNVCKNILAFIIPIILTLGILFFQGVRFADLAVSAGWMVSMSASKTLYWFYSVTGLVFRPQLIPIYFINFVKYFIPLLFIYYFRSLWIYVLALIYLWFVIDPEILIYVFPLILILSAIKIKNLNRKKKFFIISSLLVSLKLFFALTLKSYGVYFLPFALISLFLVTPKRFKKPLLTLTICSALVLGLKNSISLSEKNVKIKTNKGVVYTTTYNGVGLNALITYVENKAEKNDTILILPECTIINVLTDRKSDNKFYSLIPLYIETFGEELIIKRLEVTKPKYIVVTNYDTSSYYYSYFGQDYAGEVFSYILDNYEPNMRFGQGFVMNVFKRK